MAVVQQHGQQDTVGDVLDQLYDRLRQGQDKDQIMEFLDEHKNVFGSPEQYLSYLFREGIVRATGLEMPNYRIKFSAA